MIGIQYLLLGASPIAQEGKNLPATQAMQETLVQSLGQEDSPGGGHGNALQYSCLENPVDRGAWWATFHGVSESDMTGVTEHTHLFLRKQFQSQFLLLNILLNKCIELEICC